jgi:hypothetical protein
MALTPAQLGRTGTEHSQQAALFCWIRRKAHYHPELEWIFAVPNGGSRDKITAGKLKAEGVTSGVFDLFCPWPNGAYAGLWIEMKKPSGGVVSTNQKAFGKEMVARGYQAFVCHTWESAVEKIAEYYSITTDYPVKLPQEFLDKLKAKREAAK